jgi:uncharacterized membrane protein
MEMLSFPDLAALAWFFGIWAGFSWLADKSQLFNRSMSRVMDDKRRQWMAAMLDREVRIVDTAIMSGLQNGTAFFASTSLIALGGSLTLLNQADRMLAIFADLPFHVPGSKQLLELKILGLAAVFGYAFFKFGWSYRLFNYAAILIGAVPPVPFSDRKMAEQAAHSAAEMQIHAGHHFQWGLRALFFSIGYLGWFLGPIPLMISGTFIAVVQANRQFRSNARRSLMG